MGTIGLEPITSRLSVLRSTIELHALSKSSRHFCSQKEMFFILYKERIELSSLV